MSEKYCGKAYMCIKMLQILNTGRLYKVSELAALLETNPRNVIEYKKELELMGYWIDTVPGRYGGYVMNDNALIPSLKLTKEEKDSLLEAYNYALSKNDFMSKADLTTAFGKMMSNVETTEKEKKLMVVDKYQLSMKFDDIKERYNFIEDAINAKRTIEMRYFSLKSGEKTHIVDPYKLFIYNNSWFFLAWDHEAGDVWYFKVNRIKSYRLTGEKFLVWREFKAEKYFDEHGLKQNGEYHHVELIAKGTRAILLKERVYGANQKNEDLGNGCVKVSMDMQNDNTMVSFALSCMDEVEIIEPQWLKEKVKETASRIVEIYEK